MAKKVKTGVDTANIEVINGKFYVEMDAERLDDRIEKVIEQIVNLDERVVELGLTRAELVAFQGELEVKRAELP